MSKKLVGYGVVFAAVVVFFALSVLKTDESLSENEPEAASTSVETSEIKIVASHTVARSATNIESRLAVKHIGGGMKVYYSHDEVTYNTPEEDQDVNTMGSLGLNVLNPNSPDVQERIKILKECQRENEIPGFLDSLIDSCNGVVFKAAANGTLCDEVKRNVEKAKGDRKPILQIPSWPEETPE